MMAVATAGCRLIDDDLSVCGSDYLINYEVRLVTEVSLTIEETLSSEIEKPIAQALKKWSEPIFSGHAHDLDMSFYSLDGTDELKYHQAEIIDASRKSYTLTIPRQNYRHLATANVSDNNGVDLLGGNDSKSLMVAQKNKDTLSSHNMAVYSARLAMHMTEGENLSFDVKLYMVSCAMALVVTDSTKISSPVIQSVTLNGTATRFYVNDSIYSYYKPSVIRAEKVLDRCYAAVSLPSKDETDSWKVCAHVKKADGTITQTILTVHKPLRAGTMQIIKVTMNDDGSLTPVQKTEVGATVTLDWKEGNVQELVTG